jgi:class 3 adenylate cyclase
MAPLEQRARAVLAKLGESAEEPVAARVAVAAIDAIAEAAIAEPSAVYMQAASDGTLTILFSDIEGSTTLFDTLGDLRAQEILNAHNAIIREHVARHRGVVVKSTGDGFMMVFSSARRAILCAMEVQRALAAYSQEEGNTPIRVRMGLHVGEPLTVTNDLSGKAVIIAARIAAVARGGEILVSSTLRELAEAAGDLRFADAGEVTLKGISGTHRIYRAMCSRQPAGPTRSRDREVAVEGEGRRRCGPRAYDVVLDRHALRPLRQSTQLRCVRGWRRRGSRRRSASVARPTSLTSAAARRARSRAECGRECAPRRGRHRRSDITGALARRSSMTANGSGAGERMRSSM